MTVKITFRDLVCLIDLINDYKEKYDPGTTYRLDNIGWKLDKLYKNLKTGTYNDLIIVNPKIKKEKFDEDLQLDELPFSEINS